MKQNPFSVYDFLGYFIPGALFLYSFYIIRYFKNCDIINFEKLFNTIDEPNLEIGILFLITSYVLGHLLSFISSISVEQYSIWRYGYPSKYLLNFSIEKYWNFKGSFLKGFWRIIMILFIFPIAFLDYFLGNWFGFKAFYHKNIDNNLAKIIKIKINLLAKKIGITSKNGFENGSGKNADFFRIVLHYTYENSINHQSKFNNYVALYGFTRTISLLLNLLFWYFLQHVILYSSFDKIKILILLIIAAMSYVFFMAFMKFYRRYTLEGFMVLAITDLNDNK
ncbi:hypothetical protein [Lutibacter sp.]|uniref:hypothetical protein n=1 Tax=Lutibacter sp. TaxID=1925666 RepID=UPI001A3529DF|nr:hypothetical protein [Lutibacter sp.]MBI9040271.1 hypothetical protein [Lutibacter sp.]